MNKMTVLKNLDFWFQQCRDNLCGMECIHVPQIRYWGSLYSDIIAKERRERKLKRISVSRDESVESQKKKLDLEEIKLLIEEGMVNSEIADFLLVDYQVLLNFLKKHEIKNENKKPDGYMGVSIDEVIRRFNEGWENNKIIKYYGFNENGYRHFIRRNNVKNPNYSKRGKK